MCGRAQIAGLVSGSAGTNNENATLDVGTTLIGMYGDATDADERPNAKADADGQRNVVNWQTYSAYIQTSGFP